MPNRPTRDPRPEAPPQWRLILSFGTLYIIWGTTYLAIRFAVETLPPFLMGAGRFLIGGIALYALMRFRGAPRPRLIHWR